MQNISAGGLSVRADIEAAEEDTLSITLKVAPRPLLIHCMVWHARRVRRTSTGEEFTQMGLVLNAPSEEFMQLVAKTARAKDAGKVRRVPHMRPPPPRESQNRQFVVRVQQDGSPRTRRLVVGGADEGDAKANVLREVGAGWTILDLRRA